MTKYHQDEYLAVALKRGIKQDFEDAFRALLQEKADEIIEETVQDAMKSFNASVQLFKEPDTMSSVVRVVLEDFRSGVKD